MDRIFVIGRDEVPQYVRLDAGEKLSWTLVYVPGPGLALPERVAVEIDLCGEGAELDLAGLYLCPGNERLQLDILVKHVCGGCRSRQLFKGLAGGGSRVTFGGLIYVARDSQKTKAYQENHTILLSDSARVETRPQLEIYADDVECSHGATTGYLNPEEEYYMRSRGIAKEDARRLQTISFLSPVLKRLPEEMQNDIISEC